MLEDFIGNIKMTLGIFIFIILFNLIVKIYEYVEMSLKGKLGDIFKKCIKNELVKKIINSIGIKYLKKILKYFIFAILLGAGTVLQEKYKYIYFGEFNTFLTLVIGILTLYGIFYVFVQFALNYALQIEYDKHWGKSKTKILLMNSSEYRFFNSEIFKYMLLFSSIYPVLADNIFSIKYITSYKVYMEALWNVNIAIIFVLYAFLFIKGVNIMRRLFEIQEHKDTGLNDVIEYKVKEEYKDIFKYYYKNLDNKFIGDLIYDTGAMSLSLKERIEMTTYVIKNLGYYWKETESSNTENNFNLYYLRRVLSEIWNEINNLPLNFDQLLCIYKIQNDIIYAQINKSDFEVSEKIQEIIEFFGEYNGVNKKHLNLDNTLYFNIPDIIWDKIDNDKECQKLYRYITDREIERNIIIRACNCELNEVDKLILNFYENFIYKLLDKYLEKYDANGIDLNNFFGILQYKKLDSVRQDIVYHYIINLKYSEENKKYIKMLIKLLDYKYKVAIIFNRILHKDESMSNLNWGRDILFLKSILSDDLHNEDNIESEEVIEFICKNEKNRELIKWIIGNINRKIGKEIMEGCILDNYISYCELLKFKYIFSEYNNIDLFDLKDIKLNELIEKKAWDWRIEFLNDIVRIPNVFKKNFFFEHQEYFYEYFLEPNMPDLFYATEDFRTLFINLKFKLSEEKLLLFIDNNCFMRKGIFEFLILKLEEKNYSYLLSNIKIRNFFKEEVKVIINKSGENIKEYLDGLVNRANECMENSVSDLKKDSILFKLNELIFR